MRGLWLIAIAACGDNAAAIDARIAPDAAGVCSATFAGNFAETVVADACAAIVPDGVVVGHAALELTIPSATLAATLTARLDLGSTMPSPGAYSSDTVATWNARAVEHIGHGLCIYSAGDNVVPQGSFDLTIAALDDSGGATGAAQLVLYVLGSPLTYCGMGDNETVSVRF